MDSKAKLEGSTCSTQAPAAPTSRTQTPAPGAPEPEQKRLQQKQLGAEARDGHTTQTQKGTFLHPSAQRSQRLLIIGRARRRAQPRLDALDEDRLPQAGTRKFCCPQERAPPEHVEARASQGSGRGTRAHRREPSTSHVSSRPAAPAPAW